MRLISRDACEKLAMSKLKIATVHISLWKTIVTILAVMSIFQMALTLCLLVFATDNLCKHVGPRSDVTIFQA